MDKKIDISKDIVMELENDPLFNMSLSSKELFHSNFWGWLFKRGDGKGKEYIKIFFPEIKNDETLDIEREKGHRDITIWTEEPREAYVIENKFKSIPDKEQLEKYEKKCDKFKKGVVTGISEPEFLKKNKLELWEFISYEEISKKIGYISNQVENEGSFEKKLIDNYAEMLGKLTKHIKNQHDNTEGRWNLTVDEDTEKLRIGDLVLKLKASELEDKIKNEDFFQKESEIEGVEKKVQSAFYHKKPNVDIKYAFKKEDKEDKEDEKEKGELEEIGVQIEGYQFRRFVKVKGKLKQDEMKAAFNEYAELTDDDPELKWFDINYSKEKKVIFGKKTSMCPKNDKQYNQYVTDNYTFIYQYWNIEENQELDDLIEIISTNFDIAKKILSKRLLMKVSDI